MSKVYIPVALRRQVYERAKGCCEYCLIPDVATFAPYRKIGFKAPSFYDGF